MLFIVMVLVVPTYTKQYDQKSIHFCAKSIFASLPPLWMGS